MSTDPTSPDLLRAMMIHGAATPSRTQATQELAALLAIIQIDEARGHHWLTVDQNRTMHLRAAELQRQLFGPEY